MSQQPAAFRRLYVWQIPVRFYHWVNAVCIVALVATGLMIGHPLTIDYSTEAYQQYWFGSVRFVHFVAAFIFVFNTAARIYWGFVGNRYASWRTFLPLTRKQWREIVEVLKVDIFQTEIKGHISIGHNALAAFIYFLTFVAFLLQSLLGFALYSEMSTSALPRLFHWVVPMMGGDFAVRHWHHTLTWFFVIFAIIHVYLVFYHDYVEGRGTTSSMIGGWKFDRGTRED